MKFRTEIQINRAEQAIRHSDPILTMGSCFADNIAQKLQERYFRVMQNPFGTLYNPLSVAEALSIILTNRKFRSEDLFFHQNEWHSFWHHSVFSGTDRAAVLLKINEQINEAHRFLQEAQWLFLTFGTAYVYYHLPEKRPVANCHKLPENEFERRLIRVDEVVESIQALFQNLRVLNSKIKIVLTVSPIRHIRDGLVQNQRSKATLILAVQELCRQDASLMYFPSYEILMDDLRDYRFYEANLTHPNDQAVQYIWEKFSAMFFDRETEKASEAFAALTSALKHKPLHPESPNYRKFLRKVLKRIEGLEKQYPYVDLNFARRRIEEQLR